MASNLHLSCLPKLMLALSDGQTRFARPDKAAASKREPCHGFLVADHFAHQATRKLTNGRKADIGTGRELSPHSHHSAIG
jgi:hypothetical protein